MNGLEGTTRYLATIPLAAAKTLADTATDIQQGAHPVHAVVGNIARTGFILSGAAAAGGGLQGAGAGALLNHYLPNGAVIGKAILEPTPNDGLVYPPPLGSDDDESN